MEGSRVTRALLAPSGCLCTGKGQRKSEPQATSSVPSQMDPQPPGYCPGARQRAELPAELLPARHSALPPPSSFRPRSSPVCPRAARSRGGTSPQLQSCVPPYGRPWSIPPAYPSSVPTHSSFTARDLQKERRFHDSMAQHQAPLPPSPWAEAGTCRALPRGEGQRGRTKPRGAGQRRCQSPGSLSLAGGAAFGLPSGGPKVARGCGT